MGFIDFLPTVIFLLIMAVIIFRDRKNIEFSYGVLMRRTKKGKTWIYNFSEKHKHFFIYYSTIAVVVVLIASAFGVEQIVEMAVKALLNPTEAKPSIGLFLPQLPGITYPAPYIFSIPVLYWIVSIISIMLPHELSHAFVARAEKIKLKSFGVLLLLIFPGAFVEPDERQLKKSRTLTKLRIYAAGTFGNFVMALVIFAVAFGFAQVTTSILKPIGITYDVLNGTPASDAGLSGLILKLNNQPTPTISSFQKILANVNPGEIVKIETSEKTFTVKTTTHPSNANYSFLGVSNLRSDIEFQDNFKSLGKPSPLLIGVLEWFLGQPLFTSHKLGFFSSTSFGLFEWMFVLNLAVGLFNILPIKPLDGGLMYEEIFKVYSRKYGSKIENVLSLLIVGLILLTIIIKIIL